MAQMHLTEIVIRALKGSDKYETIYDSSTPAFGVRIGKRSKTFVVVRGRSRERVTIGRWPDITLAAARAEAKKLLSAEPEAKSARRTFAETRDSFLKEHFKGSTSDWPYIVELTLKKHFKALDHAQLADIDDKDLKKALDAIDGPSAQLHAFRVARTFFRWCTRPPHRYLKHSPMEGYPAPGKDRKGTRTLTDEELKAIWNASGQGSARVFRLLMLWGTRSTETAVLERIWASDGVLVIPGQHTKNGRDHAIPILPLAQQVLEAEPETGPYYFPGRRSSDEHLVPGSLAGLRHKVQEESGTSNWQARDIRRTFRSNMARLKVPREIAEVLINHAPEELDEIYDRYDRLNEKRDALARYEAFLLKLVSPRA